MESTITATVTAIRKRFSQLENVYYEIDIIESVIPDSDKNEIYKRPWLKLYYPNSLDNTSANAMIDEKVELTLSFYPVKRQIGDKEFTNINCHIKRIKL